MYKIYIVNNIFKLCTLRIDIYILYIYKYIYLTKEEIEHNISKRRQKFKRNRKYNSMIQLTLTRSVYIK